MLLLVKPEPVLPKITVFMFISTSKETTLKSREGSPIMRGKKEVSQLSKVSSIIPWDPYHIKQIWINSGIKSLALFAIILKLLIFSNHILQSKYLFKLQKFLSV